MATVKLICSSSARLDSIPFAAGQVIFVQDERSIYVDGTERVCYRQIITLSTDAGREALSYPLKSFYFIEDTKCLWQYDDFGWHQLTEPPQKQIVFDNKDNFPEIGDFQTLYVDGIQMYRYIDDQYKLMNSGGGGSIWIDI